MAIKIPKTGSDPRTAVKSLEKIAGTKLPKNYLTFLKTHDGAEPASNIFSIDDSNDSGVNRFIPAGEIIAEQEHLDNIAPTAFPVAWAEGGNYVVLDIQASEAVTFWDHETSELTTIAKDFEEFLSILQPFDINDVELNPEDVEEVWVNPNPKKWIDPRDK